MFTLFPLVAILSCKGLMDSLDKFLQSEWSVFTYRFLFLLFSSGSWPFPPFFFFHFIQCLPIPLFLLPSFFFQFFLRRSFLCSFPIQYLCVWIFVDILVLLEYFSTGSLHLYSNLPFHIRFRLFLILLHDVICNLNFSYI